MSALGCRNCSVDITTADTDDERIAVRDFLAEYIDDIAPNAVPKLQDDDLFKPLVPWVRNESGDIVAAALTCRSQVAAGAAALERRGGPIPTAAGRYLPVLDKHNELDLLAVRPDHRGEGLGSRLLTWMENHLQSNGVRVWFGNVTPSLAVPELRRFYARHGFTTTNPTDGLPPLLGRIWVMPNAESPAFYFYKALRAPSSQPA